MLEYTVNCEECGKEIGIEYSLCSDCEQSMCGTQSGEPVNGNIFTDSQRELAQD